MLGTGKLDLKKIKSIAAGYAKRSEILEKCLIKGIIGLPPNLFYGTGIPATTRITSIQATTVTLDKNATTGLLNVGLINSKQLQESSFTTTEEFFDIFMNNINEEDQDVLEIPTYFKYYKPETLKYSVVSYGDSGGPVYCRPNTETFTDSDYFQITVNRAMYYSRKKLSEFLYKAQYMSAYSEMTSSFIETALAD